MNPLPLRSLCFLCVIPSSYSLMTGWKPILLSYKTYSQNKKNPPAQREGSANGLDFQSDQPTQNSRRGFPASRRSSTIENRLFIGTKRKLRGRVCQPSPSSAEGSSRRWGYNFSTNSMISCSYSVDSSSSRVPETAI